MRFIIFIIYFFYSTFSFSQNIEGRVLELVDNIEIPIVGANIYLIDNSMGDVSDFEGNFMIQNLNNINQFIVSHTGYISDTLSLKDDYDKVILLPDNSLDEITINTKRKTSSVSTISSANILNISSNELLKAACCNLAESFETTPSIDVNYSDAISGRKQINMLGLASPNILISIENIPSIRGALNVYGLTFIPGTWIESIQVAKGSGSVVSGYESISGQINAE